MAKKMDRRKKPAAKAGKATRTSVAKTSRRSAPPARPGVAGTLADLVQQMARSAQVMAWRVDRMEQQLADLNRILLGLHQLYDGHRDYPWRSEDAARQLEALRRALQQTHEWSMTNLAKEVAARDTAPAR